MAKISKQHVDYGLVRRCLKSEISAYKELYNKYAPKMFGICLRYSKDFHTAEDILQDGFTKVYRNLQKFRFEGSFEGWLKRIIVNTAIEKYRKNISLYPIMDIGDSEREEVHDNTLNRLQAQDIMDMVNKLSPGYKTVFNLYVVDGYPHKDIGLMLGISEGTSKSQLARARYLLQEMIMNMDESYRQAYGK